MYLFFILMLCAFTLPLSSHIEEKSGKHLFSLGPQVVHIDRTRSSGAHQSGLNYGIRFNYQRLKRCYFYWGVEAIYGRGTLYGKTEAKERLTSEFIDGLVEGQFGYTFAQKTGSQISFTPFILGGYASEQHNYRNPSPIPVHFKTQYGYLGGGFLTSMAVSKNFSIGLNGKIRWMFDAKNHVTHDPMYEDSNQLVKNEIHYRIELPLKYRTPYCNQKLFFLLTPFYEFRHYGHQVNYPFDFLETKLKGQGIVFQLQYAV